MRANKQVVRNEARKVLRREHDAAQLRSSTHTMRLHSGKVMLRPAPAAGDDLPMLQSHVSRPQCGVQVADWLREVLVGLQERGVSASTCPDVVDCVLRGASAARLERCAQPRP